MLRIPIVLILFIAVAGAQTVTDDDRRAFDDLDPLYIDVDGDGKIDKIQPRTYQTYNRKPGKRLLWREIRNWITFDLDATTGLRIKSLFTYNYGTAENGGSYWVYALIPAGDVDKDGKTDLMFYSGDDTSDESVVLLNRGKRFIVHSRKVSDTEDWGKEAGIGQRQSP